MYIEVNVNLHSKFKFCKMMLTLQRPKMDIAIRLGNDGDIPIHVSKMLRAE